MIKILFLDTSALLSFFMSDKGTPAMRWLISSDNKAHSDTRYIINNLVIREFEDRLQQLATDNTIKQSTADNILALFNTHYKNRKFKVVGKEASVKDTMDGMYQFLGRLSRPLLVTCDVQHTAKNTKHTEDPQYTIINPEKQSPSEIESLLRGKQKPPTRITDRAGLYQRIFKKHRMTLAL